MYDIAEWGLNNGYSSGAFDVCEDVDEDSEECFQMAKESVVDNFKLLLRDKHPDGFKGFPKEVPIFRMIVLDNPNDFNRENLGYSWFTNRSRINDPNFTQQLLHLRQKNTYLIEATTSESNINIPLSLLQRDMVYLENEVVLIDDSPKSVNNIKLIKI